MKIQIVSDVHVDENMHSDIRALVVPDPAADLLVVAGDTAHGYAHRDYRGAKGVARAVGQWEAHVREGWRDAVIGTGNHDYYHGTLPKLPGTSRDAGGLRVISTPLYTAVPASAMGDRHWVDLRWTQGGDGKALTAREYGEFHARCAAWLDAELEGCAGRAVVVTHHLPLPELVSEQWRDAGGNHWFACDLGGLVDRHAAKIALWVHGHSHDRMDAVLRGVRFVRNPVGYLRHGEGAGHGAMVVEV